MHYSDLITFQYYFSHEGLSTFYHVKYFLSWGFFLVVLGCILWGVRKYLLKNNHLKKLTKGYARISIWFGVVWLFLIWSRIELVYYFSLRVFWVIYFVVFCGVLYFQIKKYLRNVNVVIKHVSKKATTQDKYLPISKKKGKTKKRK